MKKILSLLLILVLIFTACSRADDDAIVTPDFELADHGTTWPGATQPFVEQAQTPRPQFVRDDDAPMAQIFDALYTFRINQHTLEARLHPFYGETLTISVPVYLRRPYVSIYSSIDTGAVRLLADSYMRQNPGVNIEIQDFGGVGNRDRDFRMPDLPVAQSNVRNQLIDGTADTLIAMGGVIDPLSSYAGLMADWYPIMRSDPRFNPDDWFMNVFYASMFNGALLSFPIAFQPVMMAANNTIPGLAEAFEQFDFITYADILALHGHFAPRHEIHENFSPARALMYTINEYVNVYAGTADFDARFQIVMENARELTNHERPVLLPNRPASPTIGGHPTRFFIPPHSTEQLLQLSETDAFYSSHWFPEVYFIMQFQDEPVFSSPRPVTDSAGRLIAGILLQNLELNASVSYLQQALARDFVYFMLQPENQHPNSVINTAIYIPLFEQQTALTVAQTADWAESQGYVLYHDLETTIELVTEQLLNIGRMPMQSMHPIYRAIMLRSSQVLRPIYYEQVVDFAEAAEELQELAEQLLR